MRGAARLDVPLEIDMKTGDSWFETKQSGETIGRNGKAGEYAAGKERNGYEDYWPDRGSGSRKIVGAGLDEGGIRRLYHRDG